MQRVGYVVDGAPPARIRPEDVLLVWNRYGNADRLASKYEAAGAVVLVAENGYLGREWNGQRWYALARGRHNGGGQWFPVAGGGRWRRMGVPLSPWRADGRHWLVLPQRGIGVAPVAQPAGWAERAVSRLRALSDRPVVVRPHPGEKIPARSLEQDLEGAWACVTWASGAGIKALAAGVPVFYGYPDWIAAPAARPLGDDVSSPFTGDRGPALERVAWAMWTVDEIADGAPFRHLLRLDPQAQEHRGADHGGAGVRLAVPPGS